MVTYNHLMDTLTRINLDDLVSSFGWQADPLPAWLLRQVFHAPAARFARQMLAFDRSIGQDGLAEAARLMLRDFAQEVQIHGQEHLPQTGPALFLSNHPGMVDTLALFSSINRPDLRIIALNRPFLQSLPEISQHLFYVSENPSERMSAVKKAAAHLRAGGALLTFPAGQIEPDAEVYPGALESLKDWTDSAGVFLRFAPETQIVPTFVRGVLWEKAVKHPLTRIKKTRLEREKLGAALQLLAHLLLKVHPLQVKVQFAEPITLAEVGSTEMAAIHAKIMERMQGLMGIRK
jgi:hypothetical protein